MKEICVCAAIKMPDGEIIKHFRHSNCVMLAVKHLGYENVHDAVQGFWTSEKRFVNRQEAMEIQKASGLKSHYSIDGEYRGTELFSEDLY